MTPSLSTGHQRTSSVSPPTSCSTPSTPARQISSVSQTHTHTHIHRYGNTKINGISAEAHKHYLCLEGSSCFHNWQQPGAIQAYLNELWPRCTKYFADLRLNALKFAFGKRGGMYLMCFKRSTKEAIPHMMCVSNWLFRAFRKNPS